MPSLSVFVRTANALASLQALQDQLLLPTDTWLAK